MLPQHTSPTDTPSGPSQTEEMDVDAVEQAVDCGDGTSPDAPEDTAPSALVGDHRPCWGEFRRFCPGERVVRTWVVPKKGSEDGCTLIWLKDTRDMFTVDKGEASALRGKWRRLRIQSAGVGDPMDMLGMDRVLVRAQRDVDVGDMVCRAFGSASLHDMRHIPLF